MCSSRLCRGCETTCAQLIGLSSSTARSWTPRPWPIRVRRPERIVRHGPRRIWCLPGRAFPGRAAAHRGRAAHRLMWLLEGHADVVMDGVGPTVVPSVADILASSPPPQGCRWFDRWSGGCSASSRSAAVPRRRRLCARGRRERSGMDGFNAVWAEPANLPVKAEIADPSLCGSPGCTAVGPTWAGRLHPSVAAVRLSVRFRTMCSDLEPGTACRCRLCSGGADSMALADATLRFEVSASCLVR